MIYDIDYKLEQLQGIEENVQDFRDYVAETEARRPKNYLAAHFSREVMPYLPDSVFHLVNKWETPDHVKIASMTTFRHQGRPSVASISQKGTVVFRDLATGRKYDAFDVRKGAVNHVDLSPDGSIMVGGGLGCVVELYTPGEEFRRRLGVKATDPFLETERDPYCAQHRTRYADHQSAITAVRFTTNRRLVTGGENGGVLLWDLKEDYPIGTWYGGRLLTSLDARSKLIVTASTLGHTTVIDPLTKKGHVMSLKGRSQIVKFMPSGYCVVSVSDEGVTLWDLRSRSAIQRYSLLPGNFVSAFALSESGRLGVIGTEKGKLVPLDMVYGSTVSSLQGHMGPVTGLGIVGSYVVSSGFDGIVKTFVLDQ